MLISSELRTHSHPMMRVAHTRNHSMLLVALTSVSNSYGVRLRIDAPR